MSTIIAIVVAYLLGSVSTSIILCKFIGKEDIRTKGSGNPGATNMLRVMGKKLALVTLLGDVLKGVIAVLIARLLMQHGFHLGICAFAVCLGHMFPLFHKFKGGKGVATGIGAILALSPILGLAVIVTWLVVAAIFRYSSLAALAASGLAPIYALFLTRPSYFFGLAAITAVLFYRHHDNIKRLWHKQESKIGSKKKVK
jgi:glycerol-3-phosphate acyltransferase PlsY